MLHELVYVSKATRSLTQSDFHDILDRARNKNRSKKITGLLLYRDQCFLQLLEGQKPDIDHVMESIKSDERHHKLRLLISNNITQRHFSDWAMGFCHLGEKLNDELAQLSSFLHKDLSLSDAEKQGHEALALLSYFQRKTLNHPRLKPFLKY